MAAKRRRKRKPGDKPMGGGGARHPNSLANLRSDYGATPGNTLRLKHGFRSKQLIADVSDEVNEVMDGIAAVVPVRENGEAPACDTMAIELCAVALKRWRSVYAYVDLHGVLDDKGNEQPAARVEREAERALWRALGELGLSPQSRSRLGLNLARAQSFDLARHWQEQDDG
jgi:P27 family predicted phage terminase small subunit